MRKGKGEAGCEVEGRVKTVEIVICFVEKGNVGMNERRVHLNGQSLQRICYRFQLLCI